MQLDRINGKFGILGIIVILLNVGCATQNISSISREDLDTFVIDCSRRDEQIRYLLSHVSEPGEQVNARLSNMVQPYKVITDRDVWFQRKNVGSGQINYDIKQLIHLIKVNCG